MKKLNNNCIWKRNTPMKSSRLSMKKFQETSSLKSYQWTLLTRTIRINSNIYALKTKRIFFNSFFLTCALSFIKSLAMTIKLWKASTHMSQKKALLRNEKKELKLTWTLLKSTWSVLQAFWFVNISIILGTNKSSLENLNIPMGPTAL